MLLPEQASMSMNIPRITGMYANFGKAGIFTGGFFPQLLCFWLFFFAALPMFGRLRGLIRL